MNKESRKYKRGLSDLTIAVCRAIKRFDEVSKEPPSDQRGKKLAKIMNALDLANDMAMHFPLGWQFKKIENFKKKINNG